MDLSIIQLKDANTNIPQIAGERVLLQLRGKDLWLSQVLRPDGSTILHKGKLLHNDIIGKRTLDTVSSSIGAELRILRPTLADYVTLTPRHVTPASQHFHLSGRFN